jgi:hypothetical protein
MEIRIYISVKNNLVSTIKYQRTEGGFWYCETINQERRAFQVKDRFFIEKQLSKYEEKQEVQEKQEKYVLEILEEQDPDYVSLPCWKLPSNDWSETKLSTEFFAVVEHFPETTILRFSPEAIHESVLQEWLELANISVLEVKNLLKIV